MAFTNFLTSLKSTWADWRILMAARDDLDDDYNFASGPRRGAHLAQLDESEQEVHEEREEKAAADALSNASSRTASASS